MKLFYSLLVFGVALQFATYLFWAFKLDPNIQYPMSVDVGNWWNIGVYELAFTGIGAAAIGLVGAMFRQGTYAIYAIVVWAVGMLITPIRGFFLAIPNTLGGIFAAPLAAMNPFPADAAGNLPMNPIMVVVVGIFSFAVFWFLFEVVTQRQVS